MLATLVLASLRHLWDNKNHAGCGCGLSADSSRAAASQPFQLRVCFRVAAKASRSPQDHGEGTTAQAVVTKIVDSSRNDQSIVHFSYQPTSADRNFDGRQSTTKAAIELLGITVGSSVEVHYLAKWPRWVFVNALTLAERGVPTRTYLKIA